jgi:hypothetical protein
LTARRTSVEQIDSITEYPVLTFNQLIVRYTITLLICIVAVDVVFSLLAALNIWHAKPGFEIIAVYIASLLAGNAYGAATEAAPASGFAWRVAIFFAGIGLAALTGLLLLDTALRGVTLPEAPLVSLAFLVGLVFVVCLLGARALFSYGAAAAAAKRAH